VTAKAEVLPVAARAFHRVCPGFDRVVEEVIALVDLVLHRIPAHVAIYAERLGMAELAFLAGGLCQNTMVFLEAQRVRFRLDRGHVVFMAACALQGPLCLTFFVVMACMTGLLARFQVTRFDLIVKLFVLAFERGIERVAGDAVEPIFFKQDAVLAVIEDGGRGFRGGRGIFFGHPRKGDASQACRKD
jgi:hypothetical protein